VGGRVARVEAVEEGIGDRHGAPDRIVVGHAVTLASRRRPAQTRP
jgi:hypothetical protein